MDPARFDRFAKSLGQARSRRTVLTTLGAATLGAIGFRRSGTTAAQGTPAATPTATVLPGLAANNSTLFVQTARGGTLTPNPTARATPVTVGLGTPTPTPAHGAYLLTLHGHSGETIGFSDRPKRDYGEVPTARFFTGLGFLPANPPNAALVVDTPKQQGAVVLVELLDPQYDPSSQTLTYEANLLHQYPNPKSDGLGALAVKAEATPPVAFTNVSLFIDDCPDSTEECWNLANGVCTQVGQITSGNCWSWSTWTCNPCGSYASTCDVDFDACNDSCTDDIALCGAPGCCGNSDCAPNCSTLCPSYC